MFVPYGIERLLGDYFLCSHAIDHLLLSQCFIFSSLNLDRSSLIIVGIYSAILNENNPKISRYQLVHADFNATFLLIFMTFCILKSRNDVKFHS